VFQDQLKPKDPAPYLTVGGSVLHSNLDSKPTGVTKELYVHVIQHMEMTGDNNWLNTIGNWIESGAVVRLLGNRGV
jgi:hypothetical protein